MTGIPPIAPYPMPAAEELPAAVARWVPAADRAVLLVHDMQRYFLRAYPEGTAPGDALVANVRALVTAAREHGMPVAYTAQPGRMSTQERGLLADIWGPGMRASDEDREVVDAVAPLEGDWRLTKWRYSAFFRSDLLSRMCAAGRDQLVLAGVFASVGVLTTALDSYTHDIETFLVADAVADFSPEQHRMALEHAAATCAVVDTTAGVLDHLADTAAGLAA